MMQGKFYSAIIFFEGYFFFLNNLLELFILVLIITQIYPSYHLSYIFSYIKTTKII